MLIKYYTGTTVHPFNLDKSPPGIWPVNADKTLIEGVRTIDMDFKNVTCVFVTVIKESLADEFLKSNPLWGITGKDS